MSGDVQTSVDISLGVDAQVPVSDMLTGIAHSFLGLYMDPWFVCTIIFTFFVGQFVHVIMRAYFQPWRDVTKAIYIWSAQIVVGYIAAQEFVDAVAVDKFAWIAGINSIAMYYLLLWITTRWFKWPHAAQWLTLRKAKISDSGEIEFGATVRFIRGPHETDDLRK